MRLFIFSLYFLFLFFIDISYSYSFLSLSLSLQFLINLKDLEFVVDDARRGAHRRAWDYNRLESFVQTSDKSFYNFFFAICLM